MDFEKLLTSLNNLVLDPDFQYIAKTNVISSSLECIKANETDICNILAWILNPKEGHLQGDYFIKSIISAIYEAEDGQSLPNKTSMLMRSFSNIQVMTEVSINEVGDKDKSRRIDILLADYNSRTIFIIERKDGSIAHSNQLFKYQSWAKEYYKSWDVFFVLSDSYTKDHGDELPEQYVTLDDSWLKNAIKNILGKEALPLRLEQTFKEIYDFILGEWNEDSDPYFKGRRDKINKVANTHSKVIEALHNKTIEVKGKDISYLGVTPAIFYSRIIPFLTTHNLSSEQIEIFGLVQSNYAGIEIIEEFGEFELVHETLVQEYDGLTVENDKESVSFCLKQHEIKDEYWPYFLRIIRNEIDDSKYYVVEICATSDTHEDARYIAEEFLKRYEIKVRKNWKNKSKVIVEQLENTDLAYGSILRNTIDDFIKIARSLPPIKSIKIKSQ